MTYWRAIREISLIALFSSVISSAQVTNTVTISIDPTATLNDLYFLYAQGDVSRAFALAGTAPAGVTTTITFDADIPFPIPGVPYFSVIGVYGQPTGPAGIIVGLDPTDAQNLIANGTSFTDAFSSWTPFFSESDLVSGMENPNSSGADGFAGSEIVANFADIPEQQDPALFPLLNLTGSTASTLVAFSNAAAGGSLDVSVQPVGQQSVPEPVTSWLLGAGVFALGAARRSTQPASKNGPDRSALLPPVPFRQPAQYSSHRPRPLGSR